MRCGICTIIAQTKFLTCCWSTKQVTCYLTNDLSNNGNLMRIKHFRTSIIRIHFCLSMDNNQICIKKKKKRKKVCTFTFRQQTTFFFFVWHLQMSAKSAANLMTIWQPANFNFRAYFIYVLRTFIYSNRYAGNH